MGGAPAGFTGWFWPVALTLAVPVLEAGFLEEVLAAVVCGCTASFLAEATGFFSTIVVSRMSEMGLDCL